MARRQREIGKAGWGYTAIMAVIGLIYFFPVLWIILTAFKNRTDALAVPPKLFFTPTFDNFVGVFYRASITTGTNQALMAFVSWATALHAGHSSRCGRRSRAWPSDSSPSR